MKKTKPTMPQLLKSKVAWIAAGLIALGGGLGVYWFCFSSPPRPWWVKHQIYSYLKKHGTKNDFTVAFDFPSSAAMAQAPANGDDDGETKGVLTKKTFDVLRNEYLDLKIASLVLERTVTDQERELQRAQSRLATLEKRVTGSSKSTNSTTVSVTQSNLVVLQKTTADLTKSIPAKKEEWAAKEKALVPIESDLRDFQARWAKQDQAVPRPGTGELADAAAKLTRELRGKFGQAGTYSLMYDLIGQEIWVADRLFDSKNPQHRRVALNLALQARGDALNQTEDAWLAARICQAFIWPNLDLADSNNRRSPLNAEKLLDDCAGIFWQADETNNVLVNYQAYIAKADSPRQSDWARAQLSQTYMRMGDFENAVHYLKEIQLTNDFGWALRRLPWLEQRAKNRR